MRASSLLENTVWRLVVLPTEIGGDLTWRAFQQISLEGLSSTLFLFAMSNIFLSKHEGKKKKKKKKEFSKWLVQNVFKSPNFSNSSFIFMKRGGSTRHNQSPWVKTTH